MADSKNEIHNDIKHNSIPSHIVLIDESFISPRPNVFILKKLLLMQLIEYIMINIISIEKEFSIIKFILFISSFESPKYTK